MLEGKVALITGGTRGIGFETVKLFLNNKAKVVLFGSRDETVQRAIDELKMENNQYDVTGFSLDLTKEEDVQKTFLEIYQKYGRIDILINNAGVSSSTPLLDYTMEEYDKVTDLNIKAVFVCSKEVVPYLKKTEGVILNTSSMVSVSGQSSGVMYPASKFAVNGITKSLARELAPLKIRVNAVAPGIIETDMVRSLPEEMIRPLIQSIPLGRVGKPIDIANAFLFLASDMASYITGEILHVDGAKQV